MGGVGLLLHSFLTSALDGGEFTPGALCPAKEPRYQLNKRRVGPRVGLDVFGEEKNLF
jgi:hypothetical protein